MTVFSKGCLSELETVGQPLGSGSFGEVHAMRYRRDGKTYAVKKVNTSVILAPYGDSEEDKIKWTKAFNQILQEGAIMKQLNHFNVVKTYHAFPEDTFYYIVMECCDTDLSKFIASRKGNQFEEEQALYYIAQIVNAIVYLHENFIIHRDLKTANILMLRNIGKYGNLKLTDFSISKKIDSTVLATTTVPRGTLDHIAPEVLNSRKITTKVDIWSLGVIIYHICSLAMPFEAESTVVLVAKIGSGDIPKLPSRCNAKLIELLTDHIFVRNPECRATIASIACNDCFKPTMELLANEAVERQSAEEIARIEKIRQEAAAAARQEYQDVVARLKIRVEELESENEILSSGNSAKAELAYANKFSGDYFCRWDKSTQKRIREDLDEQVRAVIPIRPERCPDMALKKSLKECSILVVCREGGILAFSSHDWKETKWRCHVKRLANDKCVIHAVYDHVTDSLFIVDDINIAVITGLFASLALGIAELTPRQLVCQQRGNLGDRRIWSIAIEERRRLLFACDSFGKQNDVTVWKIVGDISTKDTKEPSHVDLIFESSIDCRQTLEKPRYCTVLSLDELKCSFTSSPPINGVVLTVSGVNDRVEFFGSGCVSDGFYRIPNVIKGKLSLPRDMNFDPPGEHLFVSEYSANRISIYSIKITPVNGNLSSLFMPFMIEAKPVWHSECYGKTINRVAVTLNPSTRQPAIVFADYESQWLAVYENSNS